MLIRKPEDIPYSEVTPKSAYLNRRTFMAGAVAAGTAAIAGKHLAGLISPDTSVHADTKLTTVKSPLSLTDETPTSLQDITHYNNFYEFGVDKGDPARNAWRLKTRPWTVSVEGHVKNPQKFDIDALMKLHPLEERIYRHRCVEAWSMVIPWVGFSLSELIQQVQPQPSAKYVQFLSLADPNQMPGLSESNLDWPYSEGLRMDEAMHPLTLLTFGLYGEVLPNQDGAPVRVVIPWKYGFKSAKSIVKIKFVDKQPRTSWNEAAPNYYGFYSNVNPNVAPQHSQKMERRIGASIFHQLQPTLMFNGYGDQVAKLYAGMDLRKNF